MSLPSPSVLSAGAHYTWLSLWQIFPVAHTCYHFLHRFYNRLVQTAQPTDIVRSKRLDRRHLAQAQRFVLYLCFIPRTIALAVAVTPASLAPEGALRPVFEQVTVQSLLVPYWPWDSPHAGDPASPAGKPELAKMFLQWDVACRGGGGGLAVLVWACFAYLAAQPGKGFVREVLPKVLTYGVVGGPVAVATVLVIEMDAAVFGASDKEKKI